MNVAIGVQSICMRARVKVHWVALYPHETITLTPAVLRGVSFATISARVGYFDVCVLATVGAARPAAVASAATPAHWEVWLEVSDTVATFSLVCGGRGVGRRNATGENDHRYQCHRHRDQCCRCRNEVKDGLSARECGRAGSGSAREVVGTSANQRNLRRTRHGYKGIKDGCHIGRRRREHAKRQVVDAVEARH